MCILVTGGAGFVGVNLVKRLLAEDERVVAFDNLSNSSYSNMADFIQHPKFKFKNVNLARLNEYRDAVNDLNMRVDSVWHLAANSDIQTGLEDSKIDLENTFMTTFNTLEIMRANCVKELFFASSSAIYGDHGEKVITENIGPLLPISNYGAMKLASEAIISSAVESYLDRAYIFRFPNVIGVPATHGVILDFVRKLKKTKDLLVVLGDGSQNKSYMHLSDLLEAMIFIRDNQHEKLNIFNIGSEDCGVTVQAIAEAVVKRVAPEARISYGVGDKGWIGDVPRVNYSAKRLNKIGWKPKLSSSEAIDLSIDQIVRQEMPF